jgi:phage regulator Rha-like protein
MEEAISPADRLSVPVHVIERRIYLIRGQRVMLDSDLAELYRVETRALVQSVKRNIERFPEDFMFQLTTEEAESMRSQTVIASKRNIRYQPYAFTEHGVAMLSAVLKSDRAVRMSIFIVRAFVQLRELLATNKELARKVEQLEAAQKQQARTQQQHAAILVSVVQDIQKLKNPPVTRAIGFIARSPKKK